MKHKALVRRLQISCLGLDPIDPLRLLVNDVIAALTQPEQDHIPDARKMVTEQEPVAWLSTDSIGERHLCFDKPLDNDPVQPLYTTPPQRTWVGLTDEEKSELWEISRALWPRYITYASLAEAKLKEKNTWKNNCCII